MLDLNELLAKAARHKMTPAEIAEQRRSSVCAEAAFGSDADEAEYAQALEAGDQEWIARLNREAQARSEAAERVLRDLESRD